MKFLGTAVLLTATSLLSSPSVNADDLAVRKTLSDYVDAFNSRDAESMGSYWTENGTHTDRETGERTEGRKAIEADIADVLKDQTEVKLSAKIDRLKFITPDVVSIDGETTVVSGRAEPLVSSFIAILVHQHDKWMFDSIEEMSLPIADASTSPLRELEWLIGEWVDDAGETKVSTTFRWSANKAFLLRSFSVQTASGVAMQGTQVIGWDTTAQTIRSWSFNSDGSFGEAQWTRQSDGWLAKSVQQLATGETATGTYSMQRIDEDAFTMQLLGHEIDGQPQPAGPSVKIVRVTGKATDLSVSQE
tara:strand:+ start:72831 stop:73742 length:912 start_codon:yes stop_codon:yes gene_type:complete